MEEDKKRLHKVITGYQKNLDSYLYFLNLMSLLTLPYWIFKLDVEILLIVFLVFIFYYSDISEMKNYKIAGLCLIPFDILTFLFTDNDINCNLIYFIIVGIWEVESLKFNFVKNYFRYYHIAIKILIFLAKFLFFSHQDLKFTGKFDKFIFKSVFFTMTLQLILKLIKIHKAEQKFALDQSNEMNKFKTLCENYPEGIFICKVRKDIKRGKSNMSKIIYVNTIAQEILKIYSSSSEKESIIQLGNFEMVNEVNGNKNSTRTNFLQFILNSQGNVNSNPHDTQYGLIKCSVTSRQSVVKINNFDLKEQNEENGSNFSYSYKIIAIEKLSDEKLQIRNIIYNNLKSKFLLTISHELNNPLNGLIYYCDKIITEDDIFKRSNIVQNIKKLKFAIKFFIKNLNLNSKIILREKINIEVSMVNFSHILNKVMNKFIPFLDNKNIKCISNLKSFTNIVIKTDYNYFKFFMKNVFMYVCHKIEPKKTLKMETQISLEKKIFKLNFLKQNTNKFIYQYTSNAMETPLDNTVRIADSVQTEGMLREILYSLAENLNIKLSLNENLSEYILSFEIEFLNLENLNEPDDLYELSPEAVSQKEDNIRMLLRVLNVVGNSAMLESDSCIKEKRFSNDSNFVHHLDLNNVSHNLNKLDNNLDEKGLRKIERFKHEVDSNNALQISHNEGLYKHLGNVQKINSDDEKMLDNNKTYVQHNLSDFMETKNKSTKLLSTYNEKINQPEKIATNLLNISKTKPNSSLPGYLRPSLLDIKYINNINIRDESRLISVDTSNTGKEIEKVCCRDVLVVDDESFNISSIKYMLKNFKLVPDTCENGLAAVQKVTECFSKKCCNSVYKLILMDVMMPIMDGFEASRKIQAIYEENQQTDLSIIIISAHDSQSVKDKIKETTFIKEFVEKPVKKSKIQELLKKYYK